MIQLKESQLESSRKIGSRPGRSWRYGLTKEKGKHYLSLEMPASQLQEALSVNPEDPSSRIKLSFFKNSGKDAGVVEGRYVILRRGGPADLPLKKRGAATRSIRIGTYEVTEEQADKARQSFAEDMEYDEVTIDTETGSEVGIMFTLPEWARD